MKQRTNSAGNLPGCFWGLLLVTVAFVAYWPALHGGFIWDDDSWTVGIVPLLRHSSGLAAIWFEPTALQQYYPLTGTTFWIDYHLWGLSPLPYHVENVLLHACAALLFWRLLVRLQVPGAWLAAGIFAWHPLMVESAGWITERKNVLSLALFLGALLAYGRFADFWRDDKPASTGNSPARHWGAWVLALFLLSGALLSKTTAVAFPAVVLLLCWWKRGRIRFNDDVLPALPFFALAFGMSFVTAFLEKNHVGAQGPDWTLSFPQRCLIAGRAFWFYLGKLAWPAGLCFIYPRWNLDPASLAQWLCPVAAIAVLAALWLAWKRIGRGPAAAAFFFVGTLFPVLGFINTYFMRYSFVCDHWSYLSSLGPIALFAALIARAALRFRTPALPYAFGLVALPALAVLTWRQCGMYSNVETLWQTTLARNPDCFLADNNLGVALADRGRWDDAIQHYRWALQIKPDYAEAQNNLGIALANQGNANEAIQHYQRAAQLEPNNAEVQYNFAVALAAQGSWNAAIQHYERALQLKPDDADAHNNLGYALARRGSWNEAMQHYERALQLGADYADTHNNLGYALARQGKWSDAIQQYRRALQLKPDYADAQYNLAIALGNQGNWDESIPHFAQALQLKPDYAEGQYNFGLALARLARWDDAIPHFEQALQIDPDYADAHNNLGVALAGLGKWQEAILHYKRALQIEPDDSEAHNNLGIALSAQGKLDEAIEHYQQALQLNPAYAEAHYDFGFALAAQGKLDDAVPHFKQALQLKPNYVEAHYALGMALAGQQKRDDAVQQLQEALNLATAQNNSALVDAIRTRLESLQSAH